MIRSATEERRQHLAAPVRSTRQAAKEHKADDVEPEVERAAAVLLFPTQVAVPELVSEQGRMMNRVTCTPMPAGKVKQEWATSSDHGTSWQVSFLGIYEKQS